jgi:hypothetical protein
MKKHYYDYDKITKDLDNFQLGSVRIEERMKQVDKDPSLFTLKKLDPKTNQYYYYKPYSKYWRHVDPNISDKKSIQYNPLYKVYMIFRNKHTHHWEFPSIQLKWGDEINSKALLLYYYLTRGKFHIYYHDKIPDFFIQTNDNTDPKYNGSRTYYFNAWHINGKPTNFTNEMNNYDDFVFASIHELKTYFQPNYYASFISLLSEF